MNTKKNKKEKKVLITGAGGFIGHHLVKFLKKKNYWVRGVDIKYPEYGKSFADEFNILDLRKFDDSLRATRGIDEVYALAADMGGMGYISFHNADILRNNLLINTHTLESALENKVERYFFASSACVYPEYRQETTSKVSLKESDAYPAQPQDAYGWEKLVIEIMLQHHLKDYGLETRIARFHNIYGPVGTWEGGREKAPAAICRKIAIAKLTGQHEIEIWGDGKQTRSFCYIDDCVNGVYRLMRSNVNEPINIGQDRLITINGLAKLVADIAGIKIKIKHIEGPQGVRGRNSDNTNLKKVLNWQPETSLENGLNKTYQWIEKELKKTKKYG